MPYDLRDADDLNRLAPGSGAIYAFNDPLRVSD
jgi:hypothetical protein